MQDIIDINHTNNEEIPTTDPILSLPDSADHLTILATVSIPITTKKRIMRPLTIFTKELAKHNVDDLESPQQEYLSELFDNVIPGLKFHVPLFTCIDINKKDQFQTLYFYDRRLKHLIRIPGKHPTFVQILKHINTKYTKGILGDHNGFTGFSYMKILDRQSAIITTNWDS